MSKTYLCIEKKGKFHDGVYYRPGDTAVMPDSFKHKVRKNGTSSWMPLGESKGEAANKAKANSIKKEIEDIAQKNKIAPEVLEGLFKEKGAESEEAKLDAVNWFIEETKKQGANK